jgi:class 3 adenylate cyclase
LVLVCPQCGQENPEGFRFCGSCGTALVTTAAPEAEERKLVTVLFVDLVGHTAASDRADPEDVRARLRPYHQLLKREIERYGGTVEKFIGDAVMAVFGAPVSHEDDAERAVRSALRILESVAELELEVRAAVATGEAVVSLSARPEQGEGIVAGDVVNTASRLQQAAPAGGLVADEVTHRATRDAVEYEELGPVVVKGKEHPVPIWRALRARGRFGVDAERAPRTAFIGREHDLRLLQETYARTLREAAVQLVTVTGEPGVGKSRLVAELAAFVDEQPERVRWRQGRCLPYGDGITFWALGEIVKAEAGILESDSPDQAAQKLEVAIGAVVEDAPEREWLGARLAPLVGASTGTAGSVDQGESFTAWRRFLEALASQRPLVLVVEDLHWADSALVEFLDHLVDWSTGVPLLIVCTGRPELYERHPGWGGGKRNSNTISLSPLTNEEAARLISALLSRSVLPVETQAALLERAGGNPLYAEEFVRMLADRRLLSDGGELAQGNEIAVPETLQALIAARLDTLAPERKALLQDGAITGKVFWAGAVASIGGWEADAVRRGLQELVRKELVRPARTSSVESEQEFSFWHLLVRDVAYGQIPRAARADKHRAAAEWIEGIAGERVEDHAELLAEHYGEALELARAASADQDHGDLERSAARFLVLAGDRAFHLDAPKSERYYERALALFEESGREYAELLRKLAESTQNQGDPRGAAESFARQAVAAFEGLGDDLGAANAMTQLSRIMWARGDTREERELLLEALELVGRHPPGPELVRVYDAVAGQAMTGGRAEECRAWVDKGLPLAESLGLTRHKIRLLQFRAGSRYLLDDPDCLDDSREAIRLGLEAGLGPETGLAYVSMASFTWEVEGPKNGLEIYRQAIDFSRRRGISDQSNWARSESSWPLFDLGEWDEILRIPEELLVNPSGQMSVMVRSYQAWVLARRGDVAEAQALVEGLLPRAREIRDAQILTPALVVGALVAGLRGRHAELLALLQELTAETRDKPAFRAGYIAEVARICLIADARDQLAGLLEDAGAPRIARRGHSVASARAVLAELEARLEEAALLHADAAERWAEYGAIVEQGHSLLGHGRSLVGLGRPAEVSEPVTRAREIFVRLDARPLVAEAETLLQASSRATGS